MIFFFFWDNHNELNYKGNLDVQSVHAANQRYTFYKDILIILFCFY